MERILDAFMNDMNLLLVGGNGDIRAVAILKWNLNHRTRVVWKYIYGIEMACRRSAKEKYVKKTSSFISQFTNGI